MIRRFIAGLLLAFASLTANATSTIDPNTPSQNSGLSSAIVRQNFSRAKNDIDAIELLSNILESQLSSIQLPSWVGGFVTAGYWTQGDGGAGCIRLRGTGPGAKQDASGTWWHFPAGKPLDVSCYGARIDFNTDDSAAFQAAVNDSLTYNALMTMPGGSAKAAFTIGSSNFHFSGAGPNKSAIFAPSSTSDVIKTAFATSGGDVLLEGFSIYGAGGNQQTGGSEIAFISCTNCRATNVRLNDAYIGGTIKGANSATSIFDNVVSTGAVLYHFDVGNGDSGSGPTDQHFNNVRTSNGGRAQATCGLHISSSGGYWINDSDIVASGSGTCLQPGTGQIVEWGFASNSALGDSGSGPALSISPTGTGRVYNFSSVNTWTSSSLFGIIITCDTGSATVDGVTLTNHRIILNNQDGVQLTCGTRFRLDHPTVVGNGTSSSGTYSGLAVAANVSHWSWVGGDCGNAFSMAVTQKYCVNVAAGASDYYTARDIDGLGGTTTGTTVNDALATGTHKTVTGNW